MKRYISVILVSLLSSMQLFSMYSGWYGAARAARTLSAQKQNMTLPRTSGASYVDRIDRGSNYPMGRIFFSTSYGDQALAYEKPAANSQYIAEEERENLTDLQQRRFDRVGFYAQNTAASTSRPAPKASSMPPQSSWVTNYLSRANDRAPQAMSSRVDEASFISPSIVSWQKYEPESYDTLNPLQKKLIREEDYAKFVQEYRDLKDVRISKFIYTVDGQPVVGFSLLPKKAPENGKYPLVIALRGGFNGEGDFHEWSKTDLPYIMRHFAFYAKHGYAVLTSQYRGADGNTNKDQFGGDDVHDVLGLFDVARDMGSIDLNDVSISAFSRGTVMAYKTLKAIKDHIPVKAVVIKGGISDLNTFVKDDPKYIKPILEQARPDFNERTEEICTDISLVCDTGVLKDTPTLVMHNERDGVVPAQLSRNLVKKLQEQGTEHEVHFFPGKHHQILESNDQVQDLTINWLNKHRGKNIKASL